jgi:hypothetical protein
MRIETRSSFIDFILNGVDFTNAPEVAFGIEVEVKDFRGYKFRCHEKDIWFFLSNFEDFVTQLETLENKRQGEAQLKQFSYRDEDSPFQLRIFSIDSLGHFAITVSLQHSHYLGNNNKLFLDKISVTFEIEPSTLPKILSGFKEFLAQQNNRKNTTK